jgi:5,10-methylenetetrahydromethanopterin reductase
MRMGLQLGAGNDVLSVVPDIVKAEAAGIATAWVSGRYDALMQLLLAAPQTKTIELATGIVSTWQRHPAALAQQALTLQSAAKGRFTLGIGVSHRSQIEGALGFEWRPVLHLKEYLEVLAPLMRGDAVTYDGHYYKLREYKLPVAGLASAPKIVVAALAPQMLRLAGRLADGTVVFLGGPRYVREVVVPEISEAAKRAGRPAPRIIAGAPVLVTSRPASAVRDELAPKLANYDQRPVYRAILDLNGSKRAADVVVIGAESEVRARLDEYAAAGVTDYFGAVQADRPDEAARTNEVLAAYAKAH